MNILALTVEHSLLKFNERLQCCMRKLRVPERFPCNRRKLVRILQILLFLVITLMVASESAAQTPRFRGIGVPAEWNGSSLRAVSANGLVAVGSVVGPSTAELQAFRWTAEGGFQLLGDLAGGEDASIARDVSADGTTVVGVASTGTNGHLNRAFRWSASDGMEALPLAPNGETPVWTNAVSADGSVVAGISAPRPREAQAYRWSAAGGFDLLGDFDGGSLNGSASGVSADGSTVVGHAEDGNELRPFRWTAETGMRPLDTRSAEIDLSMSADGKVVVGTIEPRVAFRWTEKSGLIELPDPIGGWSMALAASADASVIAGITESGGTSIWTRTQGWRSLKDIMLHDFGADISEWDLNGAFDVSADGTVIVGNGRSPAGQGQGWIAVIPEPSIGIAALAALLLRWRH